MSTRNTHVWKHLTPEREKREVRAEKFGGRWRIQAKLRHEEQWTYYVQPLMEDLLELRDVLFRKYQRKKLPFEDLAVVDKMITDMGGTVPTGEDGDEVDEEKAEAEEAEEEQSA